jgi:small subunit ribosomal protein S20
MAVRSRLRTAVKGVRAADTKEEAQKALSAAVATIDKTARKGVIHKNQAARRKSRLTRLVNAME